MEFVVPDTPQRERTPSKLEKAFMVRTIHNERLSLNGHTAASEIDRRLTELRELFSEVFSCSVERVNAITAWAKIRADRSKKSRSMGMSDAAFIRSYVSLGTSDTERTQLKDELHNMLGNTPEVIEIVSEGLHGNITEISAEARTALGALMEHVAHWEPASKLDGGEHTDYGTEIKQLWRHEIRRFLAENTIPEKRSNMKVLCLPGKQCLEIPLYIDLGFSPENILGVEGGDRIARAEFEINARRYGIQPVRARLEDILPHMRERFDVVNLDFTGPISPASCQIAEQILLKEHALVMVNTLQKRENRAMIDQLAELHRQAQEVAEIRRSLVQEHQERSGADPVGSAESAPEEFSLAGFRGRVSPLIGSMGINRRENWQVLASRVREIPLAPVLSAQRFGSDRERCQVNLQYHLEPILIGLIRTLKEHGFCKVEDLDDVFKTINIGQMVFHAVFGKSFVTKLEKQSYRSKTGMKEATFHTDMATVRTPRSLYEEISSAVEFIVQTLLRALEQIDDEDASDALQRVRFTLRNPTTECVGPGKAKKTDRLTAHIDGKRLASIRVSELLQAAANHYAVVKRYQHDDWENQAQIGRKEIRKPAK